MDGEEVVAGVGVGLGVGVGVGVEVVGSGDGAVDCDGETAARPQVTLGLHVSFKKTLQTTRLTQQIVLLSTRNVLE